MTVKDFNRVVNEHKFQKEQLLNFGDKVKINVEKIKSEIDWNKKSKEYKNFVEKHKECVFTVEYDELRKKNNSKDKNIMVCLLEDETKPKWLFYSGDLILIERNNVDYKKIEKEERQKEIDSICEKIFKENRELIKRYQEQ